MDIRKIKELIKILEKSSLAEIEIHESGDFVRISRQMTASHSAPVVVSHAAHMPASATEAHPQSYHFPHGRYFLSRL